MDSERRLTIAGMLALATMPFHTGQAAAPIATPLKTTGTPEWTLVCQSPDSSIWVRNDTDIAQPLVFELGSNPPNRSVVGDMYVQVGPGCSDNPDVTF